MKNTKLVTALGTLMTCVGALVVVAQDFLANKQQELEKADFMKENEQKFVTKEEFVRVLAELKNENDSE